MRPASSDPGAGAQIVSSVRRRQPHLLRDVEAEAHRQLRRRRALPRVEDDLGRLGVHPDVRLRARGHVAALSERATHQHEPAEQLRQRRFGADGERHVRQRAGRDEPELAGTGARLLDDHGRRLAVGHVPGRISGDEATEPLLAVHDR